MAFAMCNRAAMVGTAACGIASTWPMRKARSGMARLRGVRGTAIEGGKKIRNSIPGICAAGQAAPLCSNQTNQPVTRIDGNNEVSRMFADAVDEQRFYFRLSSGERGCAIEKH